MEAGASFACGSDAYARSRPQYPPELFAWLASACLGRAAAWDCATGNGQAAIGLAPYFDRVAATDISGEQVAEAFAVPNVAYSVQPAERTDFPDAGFDLIAVAQALHWFDFARFWPEVRRVARPGALFCAWGYSWFERDEALADLHAQYFKPLSALLKPYWAPNNRLLWEGYRDSELSFPFARVEAPPFAIRVDWGIDALIGYVRTWSAYKRALADAEAKQGLAALEAQAAARFADRGAMTLSMPLAIAAGRVA